GRRGEPAALGRARRGARRRRCARGGGGRLRGRARAAGAARVGAGAAAVRPARGGRVGGGRERRGPDAGALAERRGGRGLRAPRGSGVNTIERTALLDGLQLHDELRATVDERTLQILDRRRRTATVHRRGWL